MRVALPLLLVFLLASAASAQHIPNATCRVEDYPQKSVIYWQSPQTLSKVQLVLLRDPAGEQEARFDLMHGASLLSLRYKDKEMLYGESAGANVAMFAFHRPRTTRSSGNLYSNALFKTKTASPEKCPCDSSTTNYVSGGFYRSDYSDGLAVAMPSKNFKNGPVGGGGATEAMWRNHSFHLSGKEALDGIASKSFVWYVLVGNWKNAVAFARGL